MLSNHIISYDEYNTLIETIIMLFQTIVRYHLTEADYIRQLSTDRMNNMPDEHLTESLKIMMTCYHWTHENNP